MKKIFFIIAAGFFFALNANAQSDDLGELRDEIFYMKNGAVLHEGDVASLGNATGCYENCFNNIFYEPEEMFTKIGNKFTKNVYAIQSGSKVTIKKFKQIKKDGEKVWLVVLRDNVRKQNLYCYMKDAIESGEIIFETPATSNPKLVRSQTAPVGSTTNERQQIDEAEQKIKEAQAAKEAAELKAREAEEKAKIAQKEAEEAKKTAEKNAKQAKKQAKANAKKEKESVQSKTTTFSVADEIRKLKSLMDEGLITKEEFEAQKAKLLK